MYRWMTVCVGVCVSIKPALHSSGIILSPSCWAYGALNLQGHTNTHTQRPKFHFTCINKQRQIAVVKDTQWVEHSGQVIFYVRLACFSFLIQPEHRCVAAPANRRAEISPVCFELPQRQKGLDFIYLCRCCTRRWDRGGASNVNAPKWSLPCLNALEWRQNTWMVRSNQWRVFKCKNLFKMHLCTWHSSIKKQVWNHKRCVGVGFFSDTWMDAGDTPPPPAPPPPKEKQHNVTQQNTTWCYHFILHIIRFCSQNQWSDFLRV